jgi:16S rRNA (guanine527-N7)-methyltransferase
MKTISDNQIKQSILPYGLSVDAIFCNRLRSYMSLLLKWNKVVSLTTVTNPDEILRFHFGESLFAASDVSIREGRLADVGSGAGFPGMPLAMATPGLHAALIESSLKKCAFLSEVATTLSLPNVEVLRNRMEDIPSDIPPFDFITARALGRHDELLSWSKLHLSESGKVVLWIGGDDAAEISKKPDWQWHNRTLIPGSERRYLLFGSPRG